MPAVRRGFAPTLPSGQQPAGYSAWEASFEPLEKRSIILSRKRMPIIASTANTPNMMALVAKSPFMMLEAAYDETNTPGRRPRVESSKKVPNFMSVRPTT